MPSTAVDRSWRRQFERCWNLAILNYWDHSPFRSRQWEWYFRLEWKVWDYARNLIVGGGAWFCQARLDVCYATAELLAQWMAVIIRYQGLHAETLAVSGGRLCAQHCSINHPPITPVRWVVVKEPVKAGNAMTDRPAAAVTFVGRPNARLNAGWTALDAGILDFLESELIKRGCKSTEMTKLTTGLLVLAQIRKWVSADSR